MKKTMSAVFLTAALALTTACGGGGGRPSESEVKSALTSDDSVFGTAIPEKAADCIAGALVDSDLSDDTLNAIVEKDEDYDGSDDDKKALEGLTKDIGKCTTEAAG
jgi:hypothetical protein